MIIATAGHVDHGKTSLVRNLTSVETDRLEEEQRRGLSINLGYAYWRLDSETVLGFIDVPGHYRFINNMISGISGIDLGMLVVAADDGPMPQTREHLQVMSLLGVKDYLAVISKCDRVDERSVAEACQDTAALLPRNTPIYKVSNTTGAGIDELRIELERRARHWTAQAATGHFRMSVDRAFNLQGRGLILTGTIASGSVANGDTVVLRPQQKALRVRSIHAQDTAAELAQAGERCALNISGNIHKDDIERGDWVASESCIDTTSRFDARIGLLPEAAFALKHMSDVKLHIGAKRLRARLMLLKSDGSSPARIHPGESALAQFVTERPILCCHGDRFLLRDYGETATLGGGTVLEPQGLKIRKSSRSRLAFLDAMQHDDIEDAIRLALKDDSCILGYGALLKSWNVDSGHRPGSSLPGISRINTDAGELWLTQSRWAGIKQKILDKLMNLHRSPDTEQGVKPEQLMRTALLADEQRFLQPAIAELKDTGDILLKDGLLSAKGHKATSPVIEDPDWLKVLACLQKHGRKIPGVAQLEQECGISKPSLQSSLDVARRDQRLIKISPKRYALTSVINEFSQAALQLTRDKPTLTVVEYRDHLGCGRNTAIEVLEYFDGIGFTRRDGEARIIRDRKLPDRLFNA